jgi:hypothetical protein
MRITPTKSVLMRGGTANAKDNASVLEPAISVIELGAHSANFWPQGMTC